jgi:hypothetical protein
MSPAEAAKAHPPMDTTIQAPVASNSRVAQRTSRRPWVAIIW